MSDTPDTPTDPATLIAAIRAEMYDDPHIYTSSCRVCTNGRHAVMDDVLNHLAALSEEVSQLRTAGDELAALMDDHLGTRQCSDCQEGIAAWRTAREGQQ